MASSNKRSALRKEPKPFLRPCTRSSLPSMLRGSDCSSLSRKRESSKLRSADFCCSTSPLLEPPATKDPSRATRPAESAEEAAAAFSPTTAPRLHSPASKRKVSGIRSRARLRVPRPVRSLCTSGFAPSRLNNSSPFGDLRTRSVTSSLKSAAWAAASAAGAATSALDGAAVGGGTSGGGSGGGSGGSAAGDAGDAADSAGPEVEDGGDVEDEDAETRQGAQSGEAATMSPCIARLRPM
mmetsp:Transcript_99089/g.317887  ORF Transcript_99089/g.317887 Transcript_99089/m.317887 type:complete len:239 (+) Transcript_99089:2844-3560(+)